MTALKFIRIVIITSLILLIPFMGVLLTDEVQWDNRDFIIIGLLLLISGVLFEISSSLVNRKYKPAIAVIFIVSVLLVWAELAVGIFDSPFAGS